jgi:repressor LexA
LYRSPRKHSLQAENLVADMYGPGVRLRHGTRPGVGADGKAYGRGPARGQDRCWCPNHGGRVARDVISLPRLLVGHGDLTILTVVGDSMTGTAIADGDWVVVRRAPVAESGDIVAAMLDSADGADEATVKTLRGHDGHVWLMSRGRSAERAPGSGSTTG